MIIQCQSVGKYRYDQDPLLSACGISIEKQLTKFHGRVLDAPMVIYVSPVTFFSAPIRTFYLSFSCHLQLKVGNDENCIPRDGRWNFNHKVMNN